MIGVAQQEREDAASRGRAGASGRRTIVMPDLLSPSEQRDDLVTPMKTA